MCFHCSLQSDELKSDDLKSDELKSDELKSDELKNITNNTDFSKGIDDISLKINLSYKNTTKDGTNISKSNTKVKPDFLKVSVLWVCSFIGTVEI
jgi:hypothetical protein